MEAARRLDPVRAALHPQNHPQKPRFTLRSRLRYFRARSPRRCPHRHRSPPSLERCWQRRPALPHRKNLGLGYHPRATARRRRTHLRAARAFSRIRQVRRMVHRGVRIQARTRAQAVIRHELRARRQWPRDLRALDGFHKQTRKRNRLRARALIAAPLQPLPPSPLHRQQFRRRRRGRNTKCRGPEHRRRHGSMPRGRKSSFGRHRQLHPPPHLGSHRHYRHRIRRRPQQMQQR